MGNAALDHDLSASSALTPPGFKLNNQQQGALEDICRWFEKQRQNKRLGLPVEPYLLQGYAGVGKTTLVKLLLEALGIQLSRIALIAPTNRAAKVLANKTGLRTRTVHGLIYATMQEEIEFQRARLRIWKEAANFSQLGDLLIQANDTDLDEEYQREVEETYDGETLPITKEAFVEARRELVLKYEDIVLPEDPQNRLELFETMKAERMKQHKDAIRELLQEDLKVRKREPEEIVAKYDAILCDEFSMVPAQMGEDLVSYGVPIVMVGDPFQLPPVKAKAYWDGMRAQSVLTKIERQKGPGAGIPLAGERLRKGLEVQPNESVRLWRRNSMPDENFLKADQILVGTHKTRERLCRFVRRLRGYDTSHPVAGEKVVAVYNDRQNGIMNGEIYEVLRSELTRGDTVTIMDLRDPYGKVIEGVRAWTEGFEGRSKTEFLDSEYGKFWFGYAITVHQSQGSEWPHVIVCDDWPGDGHDRWLYTGLTRASREVDWIR